MLPRLCADGTTVRTSLRGRAEGADENQGIYKQPRKTIWEAWVKPTGKRLWHEFRTCFLCTRTLLSVKRFGMRGFKVTFKDEKQKQIWPNSDFTASNWSSIVLEFWEESNNVDACNRDTWIMDPCRNFRDKVKKWSWSGWNWTWKINRFRFTTKTK